MAVQKKYSVAKGGKGPDVVVAAGAAIAGSDALFVNIDTTHMTKSETLDALEAVRRHIVEDGWWI